jgi:hypothetical protein
MNTTDVTGGAGSAYPSVEPDYTPGFSEGGSCCSIFSFICMFCKSLVVLLCFDIRTLLTPFVSSNFSLISTFLVLSLDPLLVDCFFIPDGIFPQALNVLSWFKRRTYYLTLQFLNIVKVREH